LTHKARKRFGQNFLHDPGVIRRIVSAVAPAPGEQLVEIGPGQGAITKELLKVAGRLNAVELDRDLIEPLAQMCGDLGELRIHCVDALRFDFHQLVEDDQRLRVIGNLPYNISTPILFHLIDQLDCIQDMHFMLQKEVVHRMAAEPGSKSYGRLSVMLQVHCEVIPLFDIGPGAFKPAPKVESAFVRLQPHTKPIVQIDDYAVFGRVVTQAFAQRRKTLRNSLRELIDADGMQALGIDPVIRAERLTLDEFALLANSIACA